MVYKSANCAMLKLSYSLKVGYQSIKVLIYITKINKKCCVGLSMTDEKVILTCKKNTTEILA